MKHLFEHAITATRETREMSNGNYRKHYNSVYKFWEVQCEQSSGFIADATTWKTLTCRETEGEADVEIAQLVSVEGVVSQ